MIVLCRKVELIAPYAPNTTNCSSTLMPPAVVTAHPRAQRAAVAALHSSMRRAPPSTVPWAKPTASPDTAPITARDEMSVRYDTSAAPAASPTPSPTAVATTQRTPMPRRRRSIH